MEQVFDLPAHPLLVHLPVVAVPVVTIALAWWVLIPRQPEALAPTATILAVVSGVGVLLASSSGKALVKALPYLRDEPGVRDHIASSESAQLWGVVTMVLVVLGFVARRFVDRVPSLRGIGRAVLALALVASVTTSVFTVQAGHSGTKARWLDIQIPSD